MTALKHHTRFDVMEVEREASGFLDRVREGDHPLPTEMQPWAARLEHLATDDVDGDLVRQCLVGLNAVIAAQVIVTSEATWHAAQLWVLHVLRNCRFQPSDLPDADFARFLAEATRIEGELGLGVPLDPSSFERALDPRVLRRAIARLVDEGLGYLHYDHVAARFLGGFYIQRDRVDDWLRAKREHGMGLEIVIDITFPDELPPEYKDIVAGIARSEELHASSIALTEVGLQVTLTTHRGAASARWFEQGVTRFEQRCEVALQRRRVAAPVTMNVGQLGDSYHAEQVAAMGPQAMAVGNRMVNATTNVDLDALSRDLDTLRTEMKRQAASPEQDAEVGAVAQAQLAVREGDPSKARELLVAAGKWTLDTANKLGLATTIEFIKQAIDS